jgi:hypothetical protein
VSDDGEEILGVVGRAFDAYIAVFATCAFAFFTVKWIEAAIAAEEWGFAAGLSLVLLALMAIVARAASMVAAILVGSNGKLVLQTRSPNVGERIKGYVLLTRSTILPGLLCVRLVCQEGHWTWMDTFKTKVRWSTEIRERPETTDEGHRLPFEFDTPADLPGTGGQGNEPRYDWCVEVASAWTRRVFCAFELKIFGPLTEAGRALKEVQRRHDESVQRMREVMKAARN